VQALGEKPSDGKSSGSTMVDGLRSDAA
jgi:hypothetical protein